MRSVLFRGLLAMAFWPSAAWAQVALQGRVLTEAGAPIPGVRVEVSGVGFSVRSDSTGRFALSGQPGATLLLFFSAEGFRRDSGRVVLGRRAIAQDFTLIDENSADPEPNPSESMLLGRVVDESGTPLSYANVQINFGRRYLSDDSGRFQMPLQPGSMTLFVRRIGFEPTEVRLLERPDTAVRISMKAIPVQLKEVEVTGASSFRSLDTYGFYRRMKEVERGAARGWFITPEDLERRKPNWITQMAEGLPGIRVCGRASVTCPSGPPRNEMILGRNACKMTVFVDNVRITGRLNGRDDPVNEFVLPTHVAAMEVYPTALNAPPQFQPLNGTCGVVLIWTK
jgi:hypothetical protein